MEKGVGQNLDSDLATQVAVERTIHLAHPAPADLSRDLVRAESSAKGYCHCAPAGILRDYSWVKVTPLCLLKVIGRK